MRIFTIFLFAAVFITVYNCESAFSPDEEKQVDASGFQKQEGTNDNKQPQDQKTSSGRNVQDKENNIKTAGTLGDTAREEKRALPALAMSALKNSKVQEAVVDKGLEVMNKLVDKQLRIIDEAQEKASKFLAKEIKLDIMPDKGWSTPDMFVPPGYHMGASISNVDRTEKEQGDVPYTYAANTGLGYVMMNGCYGTNYTTSDPCYNSKFASTICLNMIDGAAFLGVGFDGRGKYSPESRKMSIVQRNCKNKASYDDLDVPDTMNVHGVYDTSAYMLTFESRSEYRTYIQQEAGVSGSLFGFYAGVKEAYGSSASGAKQTFLSVLYVDVDRYEIFMDEVKPQDLSLAFLREFMNLPNSYFDPGAPIKYQNFIQRWGTHYIKSAKFGGRLEIRKTKQAEEKENKAQFSQKMEMEYRSLFASVGAKYSKDKGYQQREQVKTTSTSIKAQGGSHEIASILSDAYSPTFKTEFKEWLQSIPKYPKAFKFLMGSISDLVNFRANDLFPDEKVTWGCEGKVVDMETEEDGRRFYYSYSTKGKKAKVYCQYDSRKGLEDAIIERRTSLVRAIEIYMEEGPISLSDVKLEQCTSKSKDQAQFSDFWPTSTQPPPTWKKMTSGGATYQVAFDMMDDLINPQHGKLSIKRNMTRKLQYRDGEWYTSDENNVFHLYSSFGKEESDTREQKISIFGLTLTYKEKDGSLVLEEQDYRRAKKTFPALLADLKGLPLAQIKELSKGSLAKRTEDPSAQLPKPPVPCQAKWSNALRMELEDMKGKCLHFTAASSGTIYVLFSAKPSDKEKRYGVEISPDKVRMFKGSNVNDDNSVTLVDAVGLGESSLYESYFVCITISGQRTLIEYGKSKGTGETGNAYLNMIDKDRGFEVTFYAFGNKDDVAKIMDAHIMSRKQTKIMCKGITVKDARENLCVKDCHRTCDPFEGCSSTKNDKTCGKCRVAKKVDVNQCLDECVPPNMINKDKECVESYDLKIEDGLRSYVRASNIPGFEELTICFWLKLVDDWNAPTGTGGVKLFKAVMVTDDVWGTSRIMLWNHFYLKGTADSIYLNYLYTTRRAGQESRIIQQALTVLLDKRWHHVCNVWSSTTFSWAFYVDGKKGSSGRHTFNRAISSWWLSLGPGDQSTSSNKLLLSQVNVWDQVLTSQEIAMQSEKCNAGVGNMKSWAGLYDTSKDAFYSKPSKCMAIKSPPAMAPPDTNKSTTPRAAKDQPKKSFHLRKRPRME